MSTVGGAWPPNGVMLSPPSGRMFTTAPWTCLTGLMIGLLTMMRRLGPALFAWLMPSSMTVTWRALRSSGIAALDLRGARASSNCSRRRRSSRSRSSARRTSGVRSFAEHLDRLLAGPISEVREDDRRQSQDERPDRCQGVHGAEGYRGCRSGRGCRTAAPGPAAGGARDARPGVKGRLGLVAPSSATWCPSGPSASSNDSPTWPPGRSCSAGQALPRSVGQSVRSHR